MTVRNQLLNEEEIKKCVMNEKPEELGESLKGLVAQLNAISNLQSKEFTAKLVEEQQCIQIMEKDNLA